MDEGCVIGMPSAKDDGCAIGMPSAKDEGKVVQSFGVRKKSLRSPVSSQQCEEMRSEFCLRQGYGSKNGFGERGVSCSEKQSQRYTSTAGPACF